MPPLSAGECVRMLAIFVDADGWVVKDEFCRVARRYGLTVVRVASNWMRAPELARPELVVVDSTSREVDDCIVGHAAIDDIVVTPDIPLAAACLERGARVISPRGQEFAEESVGDGLATREFLAYLRSVEMPTGGPADDHARSGVVARSGDLVKCPNWALF